MREGSQRAIPFMWRQAGRDKMDLVQREAFHGSARSGKMTYMNRVKRAPEQGNIHS